MRYILNFIYTFCRRFLDHMSESELDNTEFFMMLQQERYAQLQAQNQQLLDRLKTPPPTPPRKRRRRIKY